MDHETLRGLPGHELVKLARAGSREAERELEARSSEWDDVVEAFVAEGQMVPEEHLYGLCANAGHPDGPGHPFGPEQAGTVIRRWAHRLREAAWGCDCSAGRQHPGETLLGDRLLLTTARQAAGSPRIDVGSSTAGELHFRCLVIRSRQPGDGWHLLVPNPDAGSALAAVVGFRGERAPLWWRRLLVARGRSGWWPPVRLRGPLPEAKLTVEDDGTVHGYLATKRTGSGFEGRTAADQAELFGRYEGTARRFPAPDPFAGPPQPPHAWGLAQDVEGDPKPSGGPVSSEELATEQVAPRRIIDRPQA
jgi:hypothetical protein